MSDGIDNDISPKGFGQFSDGTTNDEFTHGDKYSRQEGDTVTVQDGNKSTLLNGWSNTVTTGFEFKTIGGTYVSTIGGGGFSTVAGADIKNVRGLKYDLTGGASFKFTYGFDFERKDSTSVRVLAGQVFTVGKQEDVNAVVGKKEISDRKLTVTQSYDALSEAWTLLSKTKEEIAEETRSSVSGDSTTSALGDVESQAGAMQKISAMCDCLLNGGKNIALTAYSGAVTVFGPLIKIG